MNIVLATLHCKVIGFNLFVHFFIDIVHIASLLLFFSLLFKIVMVTLCHSFFLLILLNALKLIKTSESNNSFAIVEGAINIERVFKKRSIALY